MYKSGFKENDIVIITECNNGIPLGYIGKKVKIIAYRGSYNDRNNNVVDVFNISDYHNSIARWTINSRSIKKYSPNIAKLINKYKN